MKISTNQTETNIKRVTDLLTATPERLQTVSRGLSADQLAAPLAEGEWGMVEILAHLVSCEEVTSQAVYAALLVDDPVLPAIHPQRQWARLLPYSTFPFSDLLAYFAFRREVLLRVLAQADWRQSAVRAGKRPQTVYRLARSLALHEADHLAAIEAAFASPNRES